MNKIFIIEDEDKIRNEVKTFLEKSGFLCDTSTDFENIIDKALSSNSQLILLDINLPVFDGYYICKEIRKKSNVPIIMLTSRQGEIDELMSMNLGADDFVAKTTSPQILLARINSVLKRTYSTELNNNISYKGLSLNLSRGTMTFENVELDLTKNEMKILNILIENKENIVSRDEIMEALWQCDEFVDDNTITVNVNRLRRKMEKLGVKDMLKTKRGQGYILL
ncbi:MAG: response regulator transcription factor [Clostridiales bacterium]|nr:response regulator transcription factor [Clostridiales bacterium]